jgi:methylmalonyl-CoA/ethylmalonyl-CoA epimerase
MRAIIHHIGVVVEDIAGTREFLEGALGFEMVEERSFPADLVETAYLSAGAGTQIELVELGDAAVRRERLGSGNQARIEHIAIEVEDLELASVVLERMGVEMQTREPVRSGDTRAFFTRPETSRGIVFQVLDRKV